MRYIFTDIDGVLNPHWKKEWSKKSIDIFNRICTDFSLIPILTSTWRTKHSIEQMNQIFAEQGIIHKIVDFTPHLEDSFRGEEIQQWLDGNKWDRYVVVDDRVISIKPFIKNVVECRSWIGLEEEHYEQIKRMLK